MHNTSQRTLAMVALQLAEAKMAMESTGYQNVYGITAEQYAEMRINKEKLRRKIVSLSTEIEKAEEV